jgi:type II secretory pathway predicted ATPase ExeA
MTSPFRDSATGAAFFPSSPAHAAELKLNYAVEQGLEAAVLYGSPGLGKTTLVRRALARAAATGHAVADVYFPRVDADELLDFVETELAREADRQAPDSGSRLSRIATHARALAEADRGIVIAIDDAHLLPHKDVFDTLHLLLNLREREAVRLTILLAGQPSLAASIAKFPSFAQRIAVRAMLAPLSRDETAAYVSHRLAAAGWQADTFDAQAVEAVHDRSLGVPRTVDRLCEMALLIATVDRRDRVTAADILAADGEYAGACRDAA